jgi:hypothetical protein
LNIYFPSPAAGTNPLNLAHVTYRPLIKGDSFSFSCIDVVCVAATLGKITSHANGLNGIPLVVIKLLQLPLILPVLTELFDYILTSSTFFFVWKISSVVPILKVHSPTKNSDYRPISILSFLAKTFENVVYEQMVNYVGLFRRFSLVLDLVIARQLLLQGSPMIFASKWSRINQRFLFCLTFQRSLTVCAMDCLFLICVSTTAFMLQRCGTRPFLSFSSVSKSCMWGRCFSSGTISGWCSSYFATLYFSVY